MSKFSTLLAKLKNRQHAGRPVHAVGGTNLVVMLGAVVLLLGVVYLIQVNRSATKSFAVHDLVQKHDQLQAQRRELELAQAQLSALSTLQDTPAVASLVPSSTPEFLTAGVGPVARR